MNATFEIAAFAIFGFISLVGALGMTTTMSMFRSGIFLMASFIGVAGLFVLLSADLIGLLQVMMYIGGMLVMILFMVLFMMDPGGAMMAGMGGMAPLERWFSKGLAPRDAKNGGHGAHGQMARDQADKGDHAASQHPAQQEEVHGPEGGGAHAGHDHHAGQQTDHGRHGSQALRNSAKDDDKHKTREPSGMEMDDMDMGEMSMVTPLRPVAVWLAVAVGAGLVAMLVLRPAWHVVPGRPDPDSAGRIGHLLMEKYMVGFEGAGVLILIGIFGAVLLARPSSYPDDPSRQAKVAVAENLPAIEDEQSKPLACRKDQPEGGGA